MADKGETVVKVYLKYMGLIPKKIKEDETKKTSDFEVYNYSSFLFYCEEKTLECGQLDNE